MNIEESMATGRFVVRTGCSEDLDESKFHLFDFFLLSSLYLVLLIFPYWVEKRLYEKLVRNFVDIPWPKPSILTSVAQEEIVHLPTSIEECSVVYYPQVTCHTIILVIVPSYFCLVFNFIFSPLSWATFLLFLTQHLWIWTNFRLNTLPLRAWNSWSDTSQCC